MVSKQAYFFIHVKKYIIDPNIFINNVIFIYGNKFTIDLDIFVKDT